jgi:hypothetical protein
LWCNEKKNEKKQNAGMKVILL